MTRKFLFLGRYATGKTSIKKVIFGKVKPKVLLTKSLSPTKGVKTKIYEWIDLEVSVFDTSGQELDALLRTKSEHSKIFGKSDILIYVMDFPTWNENPQKLLEDIQLINDVKENEAPNSKLVIFFHKIDLIEKLTLSYVNKIRKNIMSKLKLKIPVYFTSIYPIKIYYTYNAFFEILSQFSEKTAKLKEILDKNISEFNKTFCLILDQDNNIIVQSLTKKTRLEVVNDMYLKISQKFLASKEFTSIGMIFKIIETGPYELEAIISSTVKDNTELLDPDLRYIIFASEISSEEELTKLMIKTTKDINKVYKKLKD